MPDTPLVSVVMSVLNGECYMRECVESILAQTFSDFEFIIINDGSTDRTASILESYQQSDPRVQVYHQENRALSESLNRGCGLAQGKYIARMDADDIALCDRLMRQIEFMESHAEVDVVGGAVELIDAMGKSLVTVHYPEADHDIKSRAFSHKSPLVHPTALLRREVFVSVGGYRPAFEEAEDYDLWLRIAEHGQLANLGEVVLKYRIHSSQAGCRSLRRRVISVLASQALASSNGNGRQERFRSVKDITPTALAVLGVSEAVFQRTLATYYLGQIELMRWVGQKTAALALATEMLSSSRWEHIEKRSRLIADTWLQVAGLYWEQNRYFQSLAAGGRALTVRPIVAGRPVKQLLDRLRTALRVGKWLDAARTN